MEATQHTKQQHSLHMVHRGVLAALVVIGIVGTLLTFRVSLYSESVFLYNRALTVAASIDAGDIRSLSATEGDLSSPVYRELKAHLQKIRSVNTDVRFVYVFGEKNGSIVFYADSEEPSSSDYSPPGDVYHEATQQFTKVFQTGKPFTEGPKTDRWGTWVSGVAPIADEDGTVVAGLGIDIDAKMFYARVLFDSAIPALLTFIMLIIAFTGMRIRRKEKEIITSRVNASSLLTEYVRTPIDGAVQQIQDIASRENITPDQENTLRQTAQDLSTSLQSIDNVLEALREGKHSKHFPKKE